MDSPVLALLYAAIHHEIVDSRNPFITKETAVLRVIQEILDLTRISLVSFGQSLIREWHEPILLAYEEKRSQLSHDEKLTVERILSRDTPNALELLKFATCWYKYDPATACKWFAVDGLLGHHPKLYAHDAFLSTHAAHHRGVRALYDYTSDTARIKRIVEKAFLLNNGEPCRSDLDAEFETCVQLYSRLVGSEAMTAIEAERKSKMAQQQSNKRRKTTA